MYPKIIRAISIHLNQKIKLEISDLCIKFGDEPIIWIQTLKVRYQLDLQSLECCNY